MKPAPPVTKVTVFSSDASKFHATQIDKRLVYAEKIFAITTLGVTVSKLFEMTKRNIAEPQRDRCAVDSTVHVR